MARAQQIGGTRGGPGRLLLHAAKCWWADGATRQGAAIAFYTTLSLAPFLLVIATIAAFFLGSDEARGYVLNESGSIVGEQGRALLEQMMSAGASRSAKGWAAVIGIGSTLAGATGGFSELQAALNRIFGVQAPRAGIAGALRMRASSLLLVGLVGVLLVGSLGLTAVVTRSLGRFGLNGQIVGVAAMLANEGVTFVVATLLFALVLRVLPDRHVPWRCAFAGAALAALLFQLAKFGIGWYIGRAAGAAVYGAAAALVVLMLWIYFSAQVFLLGAEYAAAALRWREQGEDAAPPAPTPETQPTRA